VTSSVHDPPEPPHDLAEALTRVREHGGRVTRAKRAMAELLFGASEPLTAEAIATRSGLEQSVVYRTLSQFEELGIVEHVHLGHGSAVYRRRGNADVPVTCVVCGRTVEVAVADVRPLVRRVEDRTGIVVDLVHFPLSGRCRTCVRSTPAGTATGLQ